MHLAAEILDDQAFVTRFLEKSHHLVLQSRLLAEELLSKAGISYHQEGYVNIRAGLTSFHLRI
jgi:1-aminocyclopropane-1-carboxylate synthase